MRGDRIKQEFYFGQLDPFADDRVNSVLDEQEEAMIKIDKEYKKEKVMQLAIFGVGASVLIAILFKFKK